MAKYWDKDPDVVERWTVRDFFDRQEFMFVEQWIRELNTKTDKNLEPNRQIWTPKKRDNG